MSLVSVFLFSQVLYKSGLFIDLILAKLSLMCAGVYFCFNRNSLNSFSLLIDVFSSEIISINLLAKLYGILFLVCFGGYFCHICVIRSKAVYRFAMEIDRHLGDISK